MEHRILHAADILYSADFDHPKIDHALLLDSQGEILQIEPTKTLLPEADEWHHHHVVMPGMINAHIHLTDAGRREQVPGGKGLVAWVRELTRLRADEKSPEERQADVLATIEEMMFGGASAIGEVVNNRETLRPIRQSGIRCRLIHELIGFGHWRAEEKIAFAESLYSEEKWEGNLAHALGIHAPYSVSFALMKKIDQRSQERGTFVYQHLAEDPAERDLYERGEGEWVEFLKEVGSWDEEFRPPGISPIGYYDQIGLLSERLVAVHLADARPDEIRLLAARGVKGILSPTSNLHITGLLPPVRQMVEEGMLLGLGTDGRGSNPSMDVLDEARLLHNHFPDLPSGTLLRALTSGGADILGFSDLGRLNPGTAPGLVSLEIRSENVDPAHLEAAILEGEIVAARVRSSRHP